MRATNASKFSGVTLTLGLGIAALIGGQVSAALGASAEAEVQLRPSQTIESSVDMTDVQESVEFGEPIQFTLPEDLIPLEAEAVPSVDAEESSLVERVQFRYQEAIEIRSEEGGDLEFPAGVDDSPAGPWSADPSVRVGPDQTPVGGYFPTREEWGTLHEPNDRANPDKVRPSGLWRWQPDQGDFYSRHEGFFRPLDRGLGILMSDKREAWVYGSPRAGGFSPSYTGSLDLSIPHFIREFADEQAMLRLGPVAFDLVSITGQLLYSDYTGPEQFPEGEEDGWLAAIYLTIRGVVKITNNAYFAVTMTPYYLPFEGEWGFAFGYGDGLGFNLGTQAQFVYEKQVGWWEVSFVDVLSVNDLFGRYWGTWDINDEAYQRAGRYSFGELDVDRARRRSGNSFWEPETIYLKNDAILSAWGYLTPVWVLDLSLERSDAWWVDEWDHLGGYNAFTARLSYDGEDMRFAPYAEYRITTGRENEFETYYNSFLVGMRGPITQTLRMDANAGIGWIYGETRNDHGEYFLWNLGLFHEFGPYTDHSLRIGQTFHYDIFDGHANSRYATYRLNQKFGHRLTGFFYAAASEDEYFEGDDAAERWALGGGLYYDLLDYTRLRASVHYENHEEGSRNEIERIIYTAGFSHRLLTDLTLTFTYQYEDCRDETFGDFDEHLYVLSITKFF
jgi:hypothetical protein